MKHIEKRVPWHSEITEVGENRLITHGLDQSDIIRDFSYEEMVFFLLKGRRPTLVQRELLRALLVAHISHGITGQSTLAVMEAADCRSDFLYALIAGFSVGAGIYHQGGLRASMQELERYADLDSEALEKDVQERLARGDRIMGFGHRFHQRDPRVDTLLEIVDKHQATGKYLGTAKRLAELLARQKGIEMNIEGVGGGILLDLGFDSRIAHLVIILGRSPMFAAVYLERLAQGRSPFQRIEVADVIVSDE